MWNISQSFHRWFLEGTPWNTASVRYLSRGCSLGNCFWVATGGNAATPMRRCHGFGWDRVIFLCKNPYDTVFWIFVDDDWCFSGYRAVAYRFKDYSCCPTSKGLGVHNELWGNRTRAADPNWPKGWTLPLGNKSWGKGGGRVGVLSLLRDEPRFPGDSWISACQWEAVNLLTVLHCLHMWLLLYSVTSPSPKARVLTFLPYRFSPPAKFTTAEERLDVGSLRRITCAVSCRGTGKATVSWKDAEDRIHLS